MDELTAANAKVGELTLKLEKLTRELKEEKEERIHYHGRALIGRRFIREMSALISEANDFVVVQRLTGGLERDRVQMYRGDVKPEHDNDNHKWCRDMSIEEAHSTYLRYMEEVYDSD